MAVVERLVYYKINNTADAEDLLQEIYLTAFRCFPQLHDKDAFKPWLLQIARNKCSDYYRKKSTIPEILTGEPIEKTVSGCRGGSVHDNPVVDTLCRLPEKDRQVLYLCFWQELTLAEMAEKLHIPVGTVKSRLYTARLRFREKYPYAFRRMVDTANPKKEKGRNLMKKLPDYMPACTIEQSHQPPFAIHWEELGGWFLVPRQGETCTFAQYDMPSRRCTDLCEMQVTGRARVHGIDGVEISACWTCLTDETQDTRYTFIAQLTDTHCRYLAVCRREEGINDYITFLDGDGFLPDWGLGENNTGREVALAAKGVVVRHGNQITCTDIAHPLDIVGRYTVTVGNTRYDTVCVLAIDKDGGNVQEQFIDCHGRTILWRRYNHDNWGLSRYGQKWSERLPDNDRLVVDGEIFVHWYDCITDYIL